MTGSRIEWAFDLFWSIYPRKQKKVAALKAWKRIPPLALLGDLAKILEGVRKWKMSDQWQNPRFIPLPATWIANRQWEDELEEVYFRSPKRSEAHTGVFDPNAKNFCEECGKEIPWGEHYCADCTPKVKARVERATGKAL